MEITINTGRKITLFDRANFQLQNNFFFHIVSTIGCAFSPAMNKNLYAPLVADCSDSIALFIFFFFIIQRVEARAIP